MKTPDIKYDTGIGFGGDNTGGISFDKESEQEYYTDTYEPGNTKQKLQIGREVEGEVVSSGGGTSISIQVFEHLVSDGTGYIDFTGFGFTPSSYMCDAWRLNSSGQQTSLSRTYTGSDGVEHGYRTYNTTNYYLNNMSDVLYIRNEVTSGLSTRAKHNSFIEDGIRLYFSTSGVDTKFIITAYK